MEGGVICSPNDEGDENYLSITASLPNILFEFDKTKLFGMLGDGAKQRMLPKGLKTCIFNS